MKTVKIQTTREMRVHPTYGVIVLANYTLGGFVEVIDLTCECGIVEIPVRKWEMLPLYNGEPIPHVTPPSERPTVVLKSPVVSQETSKSDTTYSITDSEVCEARKRRITRPGFGF